MKFSIFNFQFSMPKFYLSLDRKNREIIDCEGQRGQALITLLFFMIIGITLLSAAAVVTLENVSSTSASEQGTLAYFAAESGIEDTLLLLLRYPTYTGGTTTYPQGQAVVTVNTSGSKITITSVGTYQNAQRTIQVIETNGSTGWQVTSWQEQ